MANYKLPHLVRGRAAYGPAEAGPSFVDLDHANGTDVLLSSQHVCDGMAKGANCSTGGCGLIIWKQVGPREWRRVFEETVAPAPLIATDSQNRFGGLIVTRTT